MPKIDFYVIQDPTPSAAFRVVCQLTEQAYKNKNRIYIHTNHLKEAHQLDEFLWTYRDDSFLPHNLVGEGPRPAPSIQIGFAEKPADQEDILFNLHHTIPDFYSQFAQIIELVPSQPALQAILREHYRFYRAAGYAITTHKLTSVEA